MKNDNFAIKFSLFSITCNKFDGDIKKYNQFILNDNIEKK